MIYLISYDIGNDRIRNKIARILESVGIRLQKSVFSVKCEPYKLKKLLNEIERLIKEDDSVIVFKLCKGCEANSIYIGKSVEVMYIF